MRLIRGAPGSGKTALVFREFKAALRDGRAEPCLVVPTATLVRHFQHELARDGVVFPPRAVMSLAALIQTRSGESVRRVPSALLHAIVRDALRRFDFPEFAEVALTDGMAATAVETIELFENAGCTPDRLARIKKVGPQAKAFERLWRIAGDAVRQCGFAMRADVIRAACANTDPAQIWLDGFVNFSMIEMDFIRALARVSDLTLTLSMTNSPAADEIRRLALEIGAEDRLLAGAARKPATTLIKAPALEREAGEIARRILTLHEQGVPFRDMAVALPDQATYLSLLRGVFDRFGIPARFYFSSPLRKHPVAVFLGGLISGALTGWDFPAAITALAAHPRWGKTADFDRFDFRVREAMPGQGAARLLELCESDWLPAEMAQCLAPQAWTAEKQTPAEWNRRFHVLATNLYRPGALGPPRDHNDIQLARSHVAALAAWLASIDSAATFWNDPDARISLEEFWRIASFVVGEAVWSARDDRTNVVHVMSAYEARQWDVASLFVCGVTDHNYPKRTPQNLLFPDSEIDRLRGAGIPLRKASDKDREEYWLLDSLRARAAASLFLSYPALDAAGKAVEPSRLLLGEGKQVEAELARACRPEPKAAPPGPAKAGRVLAPALHTEMARLHQTISLTTLEDLAQCRFKFFANRTLALKAAPERPDRRLQPRVTGLILHKALERWLADKSRDFVAHFETAFDQACEEHHLPPGYRLEVDRIQFREIARQVSANDLWKPDSSRVEVELAMDFPGGIAVTCRIDRIDRFGDDCVIVDYKSSKTANVEKLVESRTRLQGPLYALAIREKLALNPVAMIYWAVRDDKRYGWGRIPGTDLAYEPMPENWTSEARARTIARLAGFLEGNVEARPEEAGGCRWCDFAAACRVDEQTLVMIAQ